MSANYQPGQILTAASLNASLDSKPDADNAIITGGQITGLTELGVVGVTDSTSPETGAMTVAGGAGIGLNLTVGKKVTANTGAINGAVQSDAPNTGAFVVTGGVGIGGNLNVGGSAKFGGQIDTNTANVKASTPSTNPTTGALVVTGGAGIGGDLYVGGKIVGSGAETDLSGPVNITNTTPSTAPSNGALVVAGGAGIGDDLNVGDDINAGGDGTYGGDLNVAGTIYGNLANGGGGAFFEYTWYNGIVAPPTAGQIQYDSATLASVSKVWISYTMAAPVAGIQPILGLIQSGSTLVIQDKNDQTKYVTFKATAAPVMKTGYIEVPVTFISSGGAIPNNDRVFLAFNSAASSGGGTGGGGFSTSITYYTVGATDTVGSFAEGDKKLRTPGFTAPFVSVVKGGLTLTLGQQFSLDPDNVHINLTDALTKLDEVAVYFSAATSSPPALGVRFIVEGAATAGQVNIGLPQPASTDIVDVYVGGAALSQTDFTIPDPGTTLVLAKPMAAGTQYKVVGNPKYNGTIMQALRTPYDAVSTAGQTTISVPGGFLSGLVDLFINGTLLSPGDYDDTHSPTLILPTALVAGQQIRVIAYSSAAQVNPNMGAMRTLVEGAADAGTVSNIIIPGGCKPGFSDVSVGGITLLRSDYDDSDGAQIKLLKPMALGTAYAVRAWNPLTTAQPVGGQLAGFRNRIINGDFRFWQRGTSLVAGVGQRCIADRWRCNSGGTTFAASQQAFALGQTAVPGEPAYFHRCVIASVAGAANYACLQHPLENVRTLAGQSAVASFWAKADAPKNIAIEFNQGFGSGGGASTSVPAQGVTTCALTTNWQQFKVPVQLASLAGKTIGTDGTDVLEFTVWFDAGSNWGYRCNNLGQQSGTFDIARVQLEPGNVATEFESRPLGTELQLCQRYYETSSPGAGTVDSGGGAERRVLSTTFWLSNGGHRFAVPKRKRDPMITIYSARNAAIGKYSEYDQGTNFMSDKGVTVLSADATGFHMQTDGTGVAGYMAMYHWVANAEL